MRMLIAGGGTGGHLFPGIALAEEVTTRHPDNRVLFVGTTRGLEARVVPAAGFPLETIEVRGLKGMGLLGLLQALLLAPAVVPRQLAHRAAGSGRTWWWGWAATPPARWCSRPGSAASPPPSRSRTRSPA